MVIESIGALAAVEGRIDALTQRALDDPGCRTDRRAGKDRPGRARQIGREPVRLEHDEPIAAASGENWYGTTYFATDVVRDLAAGAARAAGLSWALS